MLLHVSVLRGTYAVGNENMLKGGRSRDFHATQTMGIQVKVLALCLFIYLIFIYYDNFFISVVER